MRPEPLTDQQARVLKLVKAGIHQAEIARVIGVSKQRVSGIVLALRRKGRL